MQFTKDEFVLYCKSNVFFTKSSVSSIVKVASLHNTGCSDSLLFIFIMKPYVERQVEK